MEGIEPDKHLACIGGYNESCDVSNACTGCKLIRAHVCTYVVHTTVPYSHVVYARSFLCCKHIALEINPVNVYVSDMYVHG